MKLDISALFRLQISSFCILLLALTFSLAFFWPGSNDYLGAMPLDKIPSDTRCPVCGMFVAKYDVWITQVRTTDQTVYSFDGVKDMMAFSFNPASFVQGVNQEIIEIWVKDYYSLKWIDGKKAFYVTGSDMHGPMGHELIPFSTRAAAESFFADHKGKNIYAYPEITAELIETMRSGHKMKK